RRLRIAADGEDVPAERYPLQEVSDTEIADEQKDGADRYHGELAAKRQRDVGDADKTHRIGNAGDRATVRDEVADAADRVQRAEGHDERVRQAQECNAEAVDDPDERAD